MSYTDIPALRTWEEHRIKVISDIRRLEKQLKSVEERGHDLAARMQSQAREHSKMVEDEARAMNAEIGKIHGTFAELQSSLNSMLNVTDGLETRVKRLEKANERRLAVTATAGAGAGGVLMGIVEIVKLWFFGPTG